MPDFFRASVTSTAQTLDGNESGLITANGGMWVDGAAALTATTGNNQLVNNGYIYSYGGLISTIDVVGSTFDLFNGKTGVISGASPSNGVIDFDVTSAADVINHGTIHSPDNDAIDFSASDDAATFRLDNTGEITASNSNAVDVSVGVSFFYISNAGLISARSRAIDLDAEPESASYSTLINTGEIVSHQSRAVDVSIGNTGTFKMINSGFISAEDEAIFTSISRNTTVSITNTGILETKTSGDAVQTGTGNDNFNNSGTVIGDVDFYFGDDTFNGRGGTVTGTVFGNVGNDRLIGGDGDDTLNGEDDNDVLRGLDGADLLIGEMGDDTIDGGAGDDDIDGGLDNDSLMGGLGDDTITTGSGNDFVKAGKGDDIVTTGQDNGNDTIYGQSGNDDIDGGGGFDMLHGGHGDDTLSGGGRSDFLEGSVGDDRLIGGGGGDMFVFKRGNNGDDIVVDFQDGIDRLDISDLGVFNFGRITTAGAISQDTDAAIIDLSLIGGNGSITLLGLQANDLSGVDFIF